MAVFFPAIWQVHPFREGNTRAVVMMMSLFVEHHGFYMDHELLAASAGYVRDAFAMACLDQFSEVWHLEEILLDAICDEPVEYGGSPQALETGQASRVEKYMKYQKEPYKPEPHYERKDS